LNPAVSWVSRGKKWVWARNHIAGLSGVQVGADIGLQVGKTGG
jgi:hypothetical protein